MSQTYQGFRTNAGSLQGPARGQGPPRASQLKPRHQSPKLSGGPSRSEFASIQDQAFRGNWGPRAKPKANLLLVATGSRLDSLQAKSLEPGPTKHCTRLVYTGRRNKEEDRSASSSSGGNRGPRANPKSKPCARLVGPGATSSRQVSSQNFICRKRAKPKAKPKAKPSARLVWQVQLVHALIASKLKASSQT